MANFGSFTSCCTGSNPTIGLSENTQSSGRVAWLHFHNAGYQEAYLRLAKDGRIFEMGDVQSVGVDLALLNGAGARYVYISPRGTSYFNGGNVDFGTTAPAYKLDVSGTIRAIGSTVSYQQSASAGALEMDSGTSNVDVWRWFFNGSDNWAGIGARSLQLWAYPYDQANGCCHAMMGFSATENQAWFNSDVGIGTTSPSAKLEVNGKVKVSGAGSSITFSDGTAQTTAWTGVLCGGDYAESVDVTGKKAQYEPGDVLVIDSDNDSFSKSAEPYSTSVAGIYSAKPGVVGRRSTSSDAANAEIPMAMVGIVPTKVSAENGPIRRGDLLVTSSTAGYAMKGTDRSRITGAIVGKALGRLDSDTGVIDVLVSLQ